MACDITDIGCQVSESLTGVILSLIVPILIPVIIFLVALFILPKMGKKGAVLALLVVAGLVLWYIGIPGILLPLRGVF